MRGSTVSQLPWSMASLTGACGTKDCAARMSALVDWFGP